MSTDVYVSEQIHVRLSLARLAVFVHLSAVMEEDGKNAVFHLHPVGQTGIEPFEDVKHGDEANGRKAVIISKAYEPLSLSTIMSTI